MKTSYAWQKGGSAGSNESFGFMSKPRKHLMAQRYVDTARQEGWTRSFSVETIFPYHSRASAFYFKKPYNAKSWGWGEVEHECEVEPANNAKVEYDPKANIAIVTFATEFPKLGTKVVWALSPSPAPDAWEIDKEKGGITFRWNLRPREKRETTILAVVMTDRDSPDFKGLARKEALGAAHLGWTGIEKEQVDWWHTELARSRVDIPDESLQRLYDISMYYMLNSVGGSYWAFIGVDNVIYETCMCDNPIMLHSIVETNHLDLAKAELALLDKYLPAAKKNATDRMRVVMGKENTEAALLPFYMSEDGIETWQDNVLGMYSCVSAHHAISLLKTARYTGDSAFVKTTVYPWLKAYAEYGRLHAEYDAASGSYTFPIVNMGGGGEGYWYRQTMSQKMYYRVWSQPNPMFRFADLPPIEFFPKEEIAKLESNWIDTVVNYKWIMEQAALYAEQFGLDADLREEWRVVAANLRIPQNDRFFLSHSGRDAKPSIGGAAVGDLFWPAEGTFEQFDQEKVLRTAQEVFDERNTTGLMRGGKAWDGVRAFFMTYLGRGEEAHQVLKAFGRAADHRGIQMREGVEHQNYYYLLSNGSLILLARFMMLLTYHGKIRVFPAIPKKWREAGVAFAGMPAEDGYKVSGRTGPAGTEVEIRDSQDAVLLKLSGGFHSIEIVPARISRSDREKSFELLGAQGDVGVVVHGVDKGAQYVVEAGGEKRVVTAEADLKLTAKAPTSVRVAPAGAKRS